MFDKVLAPHPTIYKWDRTWIGLLLGLVVPFSGILVVYLISVGSHFFGEGKPDIVTLSQMIHSMRDIALLIRYMSVGCVLNLGVFYLFLNKDYFNVARGVIFATILISLPVIAGIIRSWFL
ncbi:MAG: hypothetical protein JSS76_03070 [Bacteroidetes bacterium]|nr:hypothetical protein [Bacteroidota bacterium]MBS1683705.1 hypothetical protein [Bacteroidota bacterium]